MLRTRVIPCLLLKEGGLVKTVGFRKPKYVGDPINAVKIFNEKEVDELLLLDISASGTGQPPRFELIEQIAGECFMPLAYGGGIRSERDAERILRLGVEKVVLGSAVHSNPRLLARLVELFGSQSVVISVDYKRDLWGKTRVYSHGGRKKTGLEPIPFAERMAGEGAGELLVTSIDRDGTMKGYDLPLLASLAARVGVPVIACGGAGSLDDMAKAVHDAGVSAVSAGSLFVFQGRFRAVMINFPPRDELARRLP